MTSRAKRLTRRYPLLAAAPIEERPAIVRRAMMHPVVIVLLAVCAGVVLPPYLLFMFDLLGVEREQILLLKLAKCTLSAVIPAAMMTFCLSRWVLPAFIRKVMQKRGYK